MKHLVAGILLIAVGVLCICGVVGIKLYEASEDKQIELEYEKAVRENMFLVARETAPVDGDEPSNSLIDFQDMLDGDQEVEEVVTYKNVLEMPKIEVQAYIGEGTSSYNLNRGVGHHTGTANVGDIGNCVVAGHASLTYWRILNRLEEMKMFDQFYAYDSKGVKHTYYITRRFVAEPNDVYILEDLYGDASVMTVYTCTEGGTRRFVIVGTEMTEEEFDDYIKDYYSDRAKRMIDLNNDITVANLIELLTMRSTKRTYLDTSSIVLRPWAEGDAMYSDIGLLSFGIMGVVTNDVA